MRSQDVRLLFMGASIVEGWRSRAGVLWTEVLEPAAALNVGIPGETSGQLLWRVQQGGFLRGLTPAKVVLQVGANDVDLPAEAVAENIHDLVEAVRGQLPAAQILLFTIFPTGSVASAVRHKNTQTNALLMNMHSPPLLVVVECGHLFVDAHGEPDPALLPDGLHLSQEAYARWASVLFPLLELPAA